MFLLKIFITFNELQFWLERLPVLLILSLEPYGTAYPSCRIQLMKTKKTCNGRISYLRVIVATIVFGMGIDITDRNVVVHWGAPRRLEQFKSNEHKIEGKTAIDFKI